MTVVTAIDGKPVVSSQELKDEIRGKKAGQNVVLGVSRMSNERRKNPATSSLRFQ